MNAKEASEIVGEHLADRGLVSPKVYEAFTWHTFYRNLHVRGVQLKNEGVNINDMTPRTWDTMSKDERGAWRDYWRLHGHASFCCHTCQFPIAFGGARCEFCEPEKLDG